MVGAGGGHRGDPVRLVWGHGAQGQPQLQRAGTAGDAADLVSSGHEPSLRWACPPNRLWPSCSLLPGVCVGRGVLDPRRKGLLPQPPPPTPEQRCAWSCHTVSSGDHGNSPPLPGLP